MCSCISELEITVIALPVLCDYGVYVDPEVIGIFVV